MTYSVKFNKIFLMGRAEGLTDILGLPLGSKGDPRSAFVIGLETMGVCIHPSTVSRLRTGRTSGRTTEDRLNCAWVLTGDSAQSKNRYYLNLAALGLTERTRGTRGDKNRFNPAGYIEQMAITLGERLQVVSKCIRSMRADLVCESLCSSDPDLVRQFCRVAETYLTDFSHISPSRPRMILSIKQYWDHKNMVDFYAKLYQYSKKSIRFWTPYEMEVLLDFYAGQVITGNSLTHLDREILTSQVKGESIGVLVDRVKDHTGIPIDDKVIFQHRNLLVYGRTTPRPLQATT